MYHLHVESDSSLSRASLVLLSSDLSRFLIELVRGYKYHPLHVISYPLDQIRTDLSYVEEPEAILDRQDRVMRKKTIPFVKILWRNHHEREATWETEESIRTLSSFPSMIWYVLGYKYHPLHVIPYPRDQIRTDLSDAEEPEAIIDRQDRIMRKKIIPFVKILWRNHPEWEATWETEEIISRRLKTSCVGYCPGFQDLHGCNFKVNCHRLKHYHGGDPPPLEIPDVTTFSKDN
nr:hypothetical protein [Tanacetum cinerariifolium]